MHAYSARQIGSILIIPLLALLVACQPKPDPSRGDVISPTSNPLSLREGFGLKEEEGWIVLARPNDIWTVGTIIERLPGRGTRDLGSLAALNCFPGDYWLVTSGAGAGIQYGRQIAYGLSISATLGLSESALASAGLNFGADESQPRNKTVVIVNKVTESRLDSGKVEEYLMGHFEEMSPACKRNLLDPNRFLVDKILQIEDGEMSILNNKGAKVDVSLSAYKLVKEAAFKAGFSTTNDGSLKFPSGTSLTIAIRQADFSSTLARMGIERKGGESESLKNILLQTGQAIPY